MGADVGHVANDSNGPEATVVPPHLKVGFVRTAVIATMEMLQDASMAALAGYTAASKLLGQGRLWAVSSLLYST